MGPAGPASAGAHDLLFMQSQYFGADSSYAPSVTCPVGADATAGTYWHLEVMDDSYAQLVQLPAVTDVHAVFGATGVVTSFLPDEDGHGAWVLSSLGDSIGDGTYVTLESPAPKLSWLQVSGVCQVGLATESSTVTTTEPTTAPTVEPTSSSSSLPTQEPTVAPTQSTEPTSTPSATDPPIVVISVPEPGDGVVPVPTRSVTISSPTTAPTTEVLGVSYVSPSAPGAATTRVLGVRYVAGQLPATGGDTRNVLASGLALLLSGVALVRLSGRRQGRHNA